MPDKTPTADPKIVRLDPAPSKVFSWLEYNSAAEATDHHPVCGVLHVRYRSTGVEWEFWPVDESEVQKLFNPGQIYDYSIGKAFGSIIKAHKSGRLLKSGQRQETVKQREETEQRAGRRWLA